MMPWTEYFLLKLTEWFTRVEDDVVIKRQQCLNVGCAFLFSIGLLISIMNGLIMGLFNANQGYIQAVAVALCGCILIHSRLTRRPTSTRLLLVTMLFYSLYLSAIRGGFRYFPHHIFIGLASPIVSIFFCSTTLEPIIWFFIWLLGNVTIFALQLRNLLPPVTVNVETLQLQSTCRLFTTAIIYMLVFWFLGHVYSTETANRHTLQEELHVFTRLSHEIRTPITIITGIADIVDEWPNLTNEQKCILSDLGLASRRLGTVVNDLLSFSNNDAAQNGSNRVADFNLQDLIDTIIGYHLPQAEKSQLQIYVDVPANVPRELRGDREVLSGVLDHLLSNAIKFTPSGSVSIKVIRVQQESAFFSF